jgi:hypothetical protein
MSRFYTASLKSSTAITAAVDIFEILAAAGKPIRIWGWELGQTTEVGDAQEQFLALALKLVTGAPTSGSGGPTAPLFREVGGPNDTDAATTIEIWNTTKLTGGTSVELATFSWPVRAGHVWTAPDERFAWTVPADEHLVLEMLSTPPTMGGTNGLVGYVAIEELV